MAPHISKFFICSFSSYSYVVCLIILFNSVSQTFCQNDFISIDCGAKQGYVDADNIKWIPDDEYIESGQAFTIHSDFSANFTGSVLTLRSFPEDKKACYSLPSIPGSKYMVRATFLYGNYDGKSNPPSFTLILDATELANIVTSLETVVTKSYVVGAQGRTISVCFGKSVKDNSAFVNSVELIPLLSNSYVILSNSGTDIAGQIALDDLFRLNYGADPSTTPIIRYPQDPYDRIWSPITDSRYQSLKSASTIDTGNYYGTPPLAVLQSAITTLNNRMVPLNLSFSATSGSYLLCYLHFFDIRNISSKDVCSMDLYANGEQIIGFGFLNKWNSIRIIVNMAEADTLNVSLVPMKNSTLPPILNAVEIFSAITIINGTYQQEVSTLEVIKKQFKLNRYYGDPCLPKDYGWDWVTCNSDTPPRVTAIDLSNRNLNGTIPSVFQDLAALRSLNLADNNLTGSIPQGLLSITDLNTNYSGNPMLCYDQTSCTSNNASAINIGNGTSTKGNKSIILGASLGAVAVVFGLSLTLIVIFHLRNKNKKNTSEAAEALQRNVRSKTIVSGDATPQARVISGEATERRFFS